MGKLQHIAPADRKWFLLMGFLEPFMYYIGESYGLQLITSTQAAVIVSTIPLFAPILAFFFYRERLTMLNIIGIFVSIVGVAMIVYEKNSGLAAPIKGILLMFLAVFSALFYGLMVRKLSSRYNPFTIVTVQNGIGIILFMPLFIGLEWNTFVSTTPTFNAMSAIVLLAIFASSLAFMLFAHGIQKIGLSRANVFTNAIPAFTAIIAWIVLDEILTGQKIIGILIVMIGLYVSQIKRNTHVV